MLPRKEIIENNSDHSDCDDWLLVNQSHLVDSDEQARLSSSPELIRELDCQDDSDDSPPNMDVPVIDDGLVEVDLSTGASSLSSSSETTNLMSPRQRNKNKLEIIEEREDDDRASNEPIPAPCTSNSSSNSSSSASSSDPSMSGFQIVDTSDDDINTLNSCSSIESSTLFGGSAAQAGELDNISNSNNCNKRQSLSDSDFNNDFVDSENMKKKTKRVVIAKDDDDQTFAKQRRDEMKPTAIIKSSSLNDDLSELRQRQTIVARTALRPYRISMIRAKLDELSEAISKHDYLIGPAPINFANRDISTTSTFHSSVSLSELFNIKQNKYLFLISALVLGYLSVLLFFTISLSSLNHHQQHQKQLENYYKARMFEREVSPRIIIGDEEFFTSSEQIEELESLNSDLIQCIKRQNPDSLRYTNYQTHERQRNNNNSSSEKVEHKRNWICYGHQSAWRKRFEKLRSEFKMDLPKLLRDAKRHIRIRFVPGQNPTLRFKAILDQLEYLEYLDNRFRKRQTEQTLKNLTGQNTKLLRRIELRKNQADFDSGESRKNYILEEKNAILIAENKVLKASLKDKAGPAFIRQSDEIVRLKNENYLLKKFYHEMAKDISDSLRQLNIYTNVNAAFHHIDLDDILSLNKQFRIMKDNLRKLKDKTSTVLLDNEGLREELKETHQSLMISSLVKSESKINQDQYGDNSCKSNRNSIVLNTSDNPLSTESCTRDLRNSKKRAFQLEKEVEELKGNCNKCNSCSGSSLQQASGNWLLSEPQNSSKLSNSYLGLSSISDTAVEKPKLNAHLLKGDDIFNDLMALSFRSEQTNDLTKLNSGFSSQMIEDKSKNLIIDDSNSQFKEEKLVKVLPNYIRETYAQKIRKDSTSTSLLTAAPKLQLSRPKSEGLHIPDVSVGIQYKPSVPEVIYDASASNTLNHSRILWNGLMEEAPLKISNNAQIKVSDSLNLTTFEPPCYLNKTLNSITCIVKQLRQVKNNTNKRRPRFDIEAFRRAGYHVSPASAPNHQNEDHDYEYENQAKPNPRKFDPLRRGNRDHERHHRNHQEKNIRKAKNSFYMKHKRHHHHREPYIHNHYFRADEL